MSERQFPTRLKFDEQGKLEPTFQNFEIIGREPERTRLDKTDVIDKLRGYKLLTNKLNTSPKNWIRYIDRKDGLLRTGGFPIKNTPTDPFVVMKNPSKNFTWSIQRRDVIMFEKETKKNISDNPQLKNIKQKFGDNSGKFVAFNLTDIETGDTMNELAGKIGGTRSSLGKALRGNKAYKGYILMRSDTDIDDIREEINSIEGEEMVDGVRRSVMDVINEFY